MSFLESFIFYNFSAAQEPGVAELLPYALLQCFLQRSALGSSQDECRVHVWFMEPTGQGIVFAVSTGCYSNTCVIYSTGILVRKVVLCHRDFFSSNSPKFSILQVSDAGFSFSVWKMLFRFCRPHVLVPSCKFFGAPQQPSYPQVVPEQLQKLQRILTHEFLPLRKAEPVLKVKGLTLYTPLHSSSCRMLLEGT